MQTLNFFSKQIISKEELLNWDSSLRELLGSLLRYSRTTNQVGGSLDWYDPSTSSYINNFFTTEIGTTTIGGNPTLKIGDGRGVLNFENTTLNAITGLSNLSSSLKDQMVNLFKWDLTDNIPIPGIGTYVNGDKLYVGFIPIYNPMEKGVCNIAGSSNQVTIQNGDFKKLRGQVYKNPTKVRFYNEDGSSPANNEIYEVISIIDDTNMIISSSVSTEANLKMVIVGSYDLSAQGNLDDKFSYVTATGKLTFTLTASDIINAGGFIISSLVFSDVDFVIKDERQTNLFNLLYDPNIDYLNREQIITGQKTFSTHSPIFNIPKREAINTNSIGTPILVTNVDSGNRGTILIPSQDGIVFTVKAEANKKVKKIVFATGNNPGQHFYLRIDPSGIDLTFDPDLSDLGAGDIYANGQVASTIFTVRRGAIMDLWRDENLIWHMLNNYTDILPTHDKTNGQVPYWDNVYSSDEIDTNLYTRTQVDAAIATATLASGKRLKSGTYNIGDPTPEVRHFTIPIGITLPSTDYFVMGTIVCKTGFNPTEALFAWTIIESEKGTTSFGVEISELDPKTQNIDFEWIIFAK